ncbi:Pimeloyl-ACP methyl ester carboxylesterase [Flaviramulus basaltis]|uniref:Pimeloyl-ACP methyl ester carboxylesterase n=1 Tax=Flaviramulus basaltis TaxID=369401 RepID=A0A1K2IKT4_9FLAO|nr:alpha/beta hydrolase [Flaviramulus basaltis]SFZ92832.1 Pimeloyl-ACP methyl ester carboxylesterase [Flaviramulus basaltis]
MIQLKLVIYIVEILLNLILGIETNTTRKFEQSKIHISSQIEKDSFSIKSKNIHLNTGIQMKYLEAGNKNGRTILFLHGYTDTSRSFEQLITELLKLNPELRFIAPDLRGHGDSSIPTLSNSNGFGIKDFTNDILDFMKLKNLTKVDLVGHSMGSVIAQEIALEYPSRISSLTMIGALVNGKKNRAIQEFLIPELINNWKKQLIAQYGVDWKSKSYNLTPEDLGSSVTDFLKKNWVTEADLKASVLEAIYFETIKIPLATWFGALETLSEIDNSQRMKKLRTPTLIIWGEGDELTLKEDQERLIKACEKANDLNGTPVYYKKYGPKGEKSKAPGHNLHWVKAKTVASDIIELISAEYPFNSTLNK